MLRTLVGSLGKKLTGAAMPGVAEAAGDYVVKLLRKYFQTAGIDPLTEKQEQRIRELVAEAIVVDE